MLSTDLKRIADAYDALMAGRLEATEERLVGLGRELRHAVAKAHLIELGIDPGAFDVVIASEAPDSNVILFPRPHPAMRPGQPGGSAS